MAKWKTIQVRQELVEAAKKTVKAGRYRSLSEFVSDAIRVRLDELKQGYKKDEKHVEPSVIAERLLYNLHHMWAMVTPKGNVRVGLSYYAQGHLRGVAMTQIDPVGCAVTKDEPFGVVETWMFMFDLYAPISGKIIKINKIFLDEPFIFDRDPRKITWLAEIKPDNLITLEEELRDLMRPTQYETWVSKTARPQILGI